MLYYTRARGGNLKPEPPPGTIPVFVRAHPDGFATFVLAGMFISLGRQRRTNYFNHKPFGVYVN